MAVEHDLSPEGPQSSAIPLNSSTSDPLPVESGQYMCGLSQCIVCGLLTGAVASALFTPLDKALYLSVTSARPVLDRSIWRNPYQGLANTFFYRAFNTGIYYPLESKILNFFSSSRPLCLNGSDTQQTGGQGDTKTQLLSHGQQGQFHSSVSTLAVTGQLVGITSAILCHPLNMIKYASWSNHARSSSEAFFWSMRHGGVAALYRAIIPTVCREAVFGAIFTTTRHHLATTTCFVGASASPRVAENSEKCDTVSVQRMVDGLHAEVQPALPAVSAPSGLPSAFKLFSKTPRPVVGPERNTAEGPRDLPTNDGGREDVTSLQAAETTRSGITGRRTRLGASFLQNTLSAALGVLLSSPFNYVRNMQLAAPLDYPPPSFRDVLKRLLYQVQQECHIWKKGALIASRFRVGWGTLRASTGMSSGAVIYDACMQHL